MNKPLKQAKPNMLATQNRSAIWLIWLWSDGKVQQSSEDEREEKDYLFFKHFKMTLHNEEIRMSPTDQFQR